jgi:hypothetical protein
MGAPWLRADTQVRPYRKNIFLIATCYKGPAPGNAIE